MLKIDLPSLSIMERRIPANGKARIAMVVDNRSGKTELDMKVTGDSTRHMVRVHSGTSTVISMKASGSMTKLTATVLTLTQMEPSIKVIGKMISSTDMESRSGQMVRNMKVSTCKERNMAREQYSYHARLLFLKLLFDIK